MYLYTQHPGILQLNESIIHRDVSTGWFNPLRFKILQQKERGLRQAIVRVTDTRDGKNSTFTEFLVFDIHVKMNPTFLSLPPKAPEFDVQSWRSDITSPERDNVSSQGALGVQPLPTRAIAFSSMRDRGKMKLEETIQELATQVQELRSNIGLDITSPDQPSHERTLESSVYDVKLQEPSLVKQSEEIKVRCIISLVET